MGTKNSRKKDPEENSISSVLEFSLKSNSEKNINSSKNNYREDFLNELKKEILIPIENESNNSPEIIFEKKHELKIKDFFENDIDNDDDNEDFLNKFYPEDFFNAKRNKTYNPKPVILEAPRLHSKASDNYFISPFKLSSKSFGIIPKKNHIPNKIILDFQKNIIDCKSCNDKEDEIIEEYLLSSADTEKTTPNPEDLQDLINCRKKMIKFRNSINYRPCYEYENILNCDYIIDNIQEDKKINHKKKKSHWNKYIQDQLKKEKNKYYEHNKRLNSEPFPELNINYNNFSKANEDEKIEEKVENKDSDDDDNNLFILGIIQRAAKERKRTKSVVAK